MSAILNPAGFALLGFIGVVAAIAIVYFMRRTPGGDA